MHALILCQRISHYWKRIINLKNKMEHQSPKMLNKKSSDKISKTAISWEINNSLKTNFTPLRLSPRLST